MVGISVFEIPYHEIVMDEEKQVNCFLNAALALANRDEPRIRKIFLGFTEGYFSKFVEYAIRNKTAGIIYHLLNELKLSSLLPPYINRMFGTIYLSQWKKNESILREMISLKHIAQQHRIELIFFKGLILSQGLFGDIACRSSADIDILVKRIDLIKAEKMLAENGFKRTSIIFPNRRFAIKKALSHFQYERADLIIELHWQFQNLPYAVFDEKKAWKNKRQVLLNGMEFSSLNEENSLLFYLLSLFTDLQKGRELNVRNLLDVYMIILKGYEIIDWQEFFKERKKDGTYYICASLLYNLFELLSIQGEFSRLKEVIDQIEKPRPHFAISGFKSSNSLSAAFTNRIEAVKLYKKPLSGIFAWRLLTLPSRLTGYGWPDVARKVKSKMYP